MYRRNGSYLEFVGLAQVAAQHSIDHRGGERSTKKELRRGGVCSETVAGENR